MMFIPSLFSQRLDCLLLLATSWKEWQWRFVIPLLRLPQMQPQFIEEQAAEILNTARICTSGRSSQRSLSDRSTPHSGSLEWFQPHRQNSVIIVWHTEKHGRGCKKQSRSIENGYKHKQLMQCNKMWRASHTCCTSVWMNLLSNLLVFRKNLWFISAKFFVGCGLIRWSCCVAQLTSFFLPRNENLTCSVSSAGLGSALQLYPACTTAITITWQLCLQSARPSGHRSTRGFILSLRPTTYKSNKKNKKQTLVFSERAGHELQPQQDRCSLRTVRLKCPDSIHTANGPLNGLQSEFHRIVLGLPVELMTAFILYLQEVKILEWVCWQVIYQKSTFLIP